MSGVATGLGKVAQGMNDEAAQGDAGRSAMGWETQGLNGAREIYDQSKGGFKEYQDTGNQAEDLLQKGMGQTGSLGRAFTMADFNEDPGYKFDTSQALQAIGNSNSVRGGALSGGTLKALTNYSTQQASNEFGAAAGRFKANQDQNFGQLSSLAGQGLHATDSVASLGTSYSHLMNDQYNGLGKTQAGMILGQAAGRDEAIGGMAGAMGSAMTSGGIGVGS